MDSNTVTLLGMIIVAAPGILSLIWQAYREKHRMPSEERQLKIDGDLTSGTLAEKWEAMASRLTDKNISLEQQLDKEGVAHAVEQDNLMREIERLKTEVKEIKSSFEQERIENAKWRDWARRLVLQLQSWNITPTPFDLEQAKKDMSSLGDMGLYKPTETN
jgi:hypothetical protein